MQKCPAVPGEEVQRDSEGRGESFSKASPQGRGCRSLHAGACLLENRGLYPESHREPQQSLEQRRERIRCVFIKHDAGGWTEQNGRAWGQSKNRKASSELLQESREVLGSGLQ